MKTNKLILALTALIVVAINFVSCSKDDDKDSGGEKKKTLIGGWGFDNSDDTEQGYYIFEEDGTGLDVKIDNPDDPDPQIDIELFEWKVSKSMLTLSRGACQEVLDYFISSNGKKLNITDEDDDTENLTRLNESELQDVRDKLNLDPDLVGFWKTEVNDTYIEIDPDGYGTQLNLNNLILFTTVKWESKDGAVSFKTFGGTSVKQNYSVADDNSYFMFASSKYLRITEQEYRNQFNLLTKTHSIVSAWEDQNSWTADPASSILSPSYINHFIVFNNDGTFTSLLLKSKNKTGTNITDVKKYEGKWQFDRSLFTYTINNNERYDAVPWRLQKGFLECGLPFNYPIGLASDQYWGSGKFRTTNIAQIEQYL